MPTWPSLYKKTTDRRKEWVALKKAHAAELKKSKVDFDAKLGDAIDKFEAQVKKMATEDYGKKSTSKSWSTVASAASQLSTLAHTYQGKLASLPTATKSDMVTFLKALEADAKLWHDAAQAPAPTQSGQLPAASWDAIHAAIGHLTSLQQHSQQLGEAIVATRQAALEAANAAPPQPVDPAALAAWAAHEEQAGAIHDATPAALKAAKRLEALRVNVSNDATYLTVFKQEGQRALSGPFAGLRPLLAAWRPVHKLLKQKAAYKPQSGMVDVQAFYLEDDFTKLEQAFKLL